MSLQPIRVLVVDDSLTVRARLVRALGADPGFQVVGEAASGEEAVRLCEQLRPDLVTLDLMLRTRMTGLEVTEHLMAFCPTPILIVSASLNRGEVLRMLDALMAGAVEVIEKPRGDEPEGAWERAFLAMARLVARIPVVTHVRGRLRSGSAPAQGAPARGFTPPAPARGFTPPAPARGFTPPAPARARTWTDGHTSLGLSGSRSPAPPAAPPTGRYRLIALGASTGGPSAIVDILRGLPDPAPLPVLLVLHLGQPFGIAFASWLDGMVPISVRDAVDGEPLPRPGEARVVIAPPDRHLVVEAGRIRLTSGPERHSCRPSVDELFESVAAELGASAIGCLLTGMGKDGAQGLLAMRQAGAATLAQDEPTSVVFGMPKEAIRLGAAAQVLPLQEIAPALAALTRS